MFVTHWCLIHWWVSGLQRARVWNGGVGTWARTHIFPDHSLERFGDLGSQELSTAGFMVKGGRR